MAFLAICHFIFVHAGKVEKILPKIFIPESVFVHGKTISLAVNQIKLYFEILRRKRFFMF